MKRILPLALLLCAQLAFGQTNEIVNVAGTKCSIIPPTGFVTTDKFNGFINTGNGASIMVNQIPASYQEMVDGFTASALKRNKMNLISKEIVDFNNGKACYIQVTQSANSTTYYKHILMFGDDQNVILVNGIYPESAKNIEAEIKKAIFSTVYDAKKETASQTIPFTISVEHSDFKFIRHMSGTSLYAVDEKNTPEKPILMVSNSVDESIISAQDQKKYAIDRLKRLPQGIEYAVKETHEITIDSLKGYEIIAYRPLKNNIKELLYEVMLFDDMGGYYMVLGMSSEKHEEYLATYKKIAKTFQRK